MPLSFSIWNNTTVVMVVDHGNFNIIRGNYHHLDQSTTVINPDPIGSTATRQSSVSPTTLTPDFQVPPNPSVDPPVNRQSSVPTNPLAPNIPGPIPPNPSVEPPDHEEDTSSIPEAPYQPVDVAELAQSTMETSTRDDEHSPLHQSSTVTEASEPQLPLSPHQTNRFKSFRRRIKHRLKRALDNFRAQHR